MRAALRFPIPRIAFWALGVLSVCTLVGWLLWAALAAVKGLEWHAGAQHASTYLRSEDLEGDGLSELIRAGFGSVWIYRHGNWLDKVCTEQINVLADTLNPTNYNVLDVDGDGTKEIVLPLLNRGKSFVRAYTPDGDTVWTSNSISEFALLSDGRWPATTNLTLLKAAGRRHLVYTTNTAYRRTTRAVGVFDIATGREIWSVPMASIPRSVVVEDVLGDDGLPEILVGTLAASNRVAVRRTDDSHSYVLLLSADGEILWEDVVGRVFSQVEVGAGDLDGDGDADVYLIKHAGGEAGSLTEIQIRDAETGRVLRKKDFHGGLLGGWDVLDLDRDGKQEFVVGTSTGHVLVLEHDLTEHHRTSVSASAIRDMKTTDIEGDGSPEIVCATSTSLAILDQNCRVIAEGPFFGGFLLIKGEGGGQHTVFTIGKQGYLSEVAVVPGSGPSIRLAIEIAVGALLTIWTLLLVRRSMVSRRQVRQEAAWDRLQLEMRELWHGEASRNSLSKLERCIREAVSKGPAGSEESSEGQKQISAIAAEFLHTSGDQARVIFRMASHLGLLHQQGKDSGRGRERRALAALGSLASAEGSPITLQESLAAVQQIRGKLSGIQDKLKKHYSSDLLMETHRALRKGLGGIQPRGESAGGRPLGGEQGISVRMEVDAFPLVYMRPADLQAVLVNVFQNAARAMESSSNPRLDIEVNANPIHTRMVIRDNGCGIPEDQWEKIFEPGVTTKQGDHGQGLSLCRERLAQFRGGLRVLESSVGTGTAMELRFERVTVPKMTSS